MVLFLLSYYVISMTPGYDNIVITMELSIILDLLRFIVALAGNN